MPRKTACNAVPSKVFTALQLVVHAKNLLQSAACLSVCGKIILTSEALFTLRTLPPLPRRLYLVKKTPQLQKVIHAECRSASGDFLESICRDHVRHARQQRLEVPARVVIKNPILAPVKLPRYQFELGATKRMEGMGDAESACGRSYTICIR